MTWARLLRQRWIKHIKDNYIYIPLVILEYILTYKISIHLRRLQRPPGTLYASHIKIITQLLQMPKTHRTYCIAILFTLFYKSTDSLIIIATILTSVIGSS